MKVTLKLLPLLALLCIGTASANIPDYVDFWAEQTSANGTWSVVDNHNKYNYADPVWEQTWNLKIDNEYNPNMVKYLWLEIEFSVAGKSAEPPMVVATDDATVNYLGAQVSFGTNTTDVTWEWVLIPQPGTEWIEFQFGDEQFPVQGFQWNLDQQTDINKIEIGTYCVVPVPSSLFLCGIGVAFAAVARRIRRK